MSLATRPAYLQLWQPVGPLSGQEGSVAWTFVSLWDISAQSMLCKSLQGLGKTVMASRLFGISGNARCQELVNVIDWETQIEVFLGSCQMSWP